MPIYSSECNDIRYFIILSVFLTVVCQVFCGFLFTSYLGTCINMLPFTNIILWIKTYSKPELGTYYILFIQKHTCFERKTFKAFENKKKQKVCGHIFENHLPKGFLGAIKNWALGCQQFHFLAHTKQIY